MTPYERLIPLAAVAIVLWIIQLAVFFTYKGKIFAYLRHTIEGPDGLPSGKRITAVWFVLLATLNSFSIVAIVWILTIKGIACDDKDLQLIQQLIHLEYVLIIAGLLYWGVITFAQVIQFKNGNNKTGGNNEPDNQGQDPAGPKQ